MKKVLLVLLLAAPALAKANEVEDLKRLVISLNQHVVNLEKRVKELESLIQSKPVNITVEKVTWRKLQRGMSYSQVREILGEPKKISGGYTTYWYYKSNNYESMVTFTNDKVSGWQEPN